MLPVIIKVEGDSIGAFGSPAFVLSPASALSPTSSFGQDEPPSTPETSKHPMEAPEYPRRGEKRTAADDTLAKINKVLCSVAEILDRREESANLTFGKYIAIQLNKKSEKRQKKIRKLIVTILEDSDSE